MRSAADRTSHERDNEKHLCVYIINGIAQLMQRLVAVLADERQVRSSLRSRVDDFKGAERFVPNAR